MKTSLRPFRAVIGRGERDHDGAHLGMNIAEDIRDSFPPESYLLRRACLIKDQVEAAPLEFREDVVKERISIGKVHDTANRHDEQVGRELFVLLQQGISLARSGDGDPGPWSGVSQMAAGGCRRVCSACAVTSSSCWECIVSALASNHPKIMPFTQWLRFGRGSAWLKPEPPATPYTSATECGPIA